MDQRLLTAVIAVEIALGNVGDVVTGTIADPIDIRRWTFRQRTYALAIDARA